MKNLYRISKKTLFQRSQSLVFGTQVIKMIHTIDFQIYYFSCSSHLQFLTTIIFITLPIIIILDSIANSDIIKYSDTFVINLMSLHGCDTFKEYKTRLYS